ncbi:MAG: type I secretion system permease/ATPase [Burkholderiaceae bacterium]|nr:type I secretion system permease/ATPase [Burkholderiaceae bacterium]
MNNKNPYRGRNELSVTLRSFRREFIVVGIFSFVSNLMLLAPTIYMLQLFDRVMISGSELTLLAVSMITLFLFVVMAFSEWARARVLVRAGLRFDNELSTRVFNASFEAYLSQTGANPSRAFNDLIQVRQFLTGQGLFAFFDAPWAPIYIAVTFMLHPWLGILALIFALVQAALAWFGHRHTVKPSEDAAKASNDVSAYLYGKVRNAEVLESMGMIRNLHGHWDERHQNAMAQGNVAQAQSHKVVAFSKFIRYSQQSLSLGAGALLVIDGRLSAGAMIAANVLMSRALAPIDQLVGSWRVFVSTRAAYQRLSALLKAYPERDATLTRVAPSGKLELRKVSASAPGRTTAILKDISFSVAAGTVVVVLGPSGSGKSTLARTMIGIWPDVRGEVLLDGLPIQGWNRMELGPHLGYLPQDVELFDGTIAENISRFRELDSPKIIEAARCAGLHDMILRLPKGYDTPIGEAGSLLSGGQRQRIGLARAVYGDPALVVLDEPNANLDDAGELALLRTVSELKAKGKTVFLITHRPGAVAAADRLMILRDGRIEHEGPRDEVVAKLRAQSLPSTPGSSATGALPA